tara:strand:+ start:2884 stop:3132 length:249 start_codon:yes stop_codon:yes gene_type:complete
MQDQQQMNLNIDLKASKGIETEDGNVIFQQGMILRSISKFITGSDEDSILPIPIFYDPISQKILEGTIPKELREEYKDFLIK